jgi:hypothetical protein
MWSCAEVAGEVLMHLRNIGEEIIRTPLSRDDTALPYELEQLPNGTQLERYETESARVIPYLFGQQIKSRYSRELRI